MMSLPAGLSAPARGPDSIKVLRISEFGDGRVVRGNQRRLVGLQFLHHLLQYHGFTLGDVVLFERVL